jgi:hypothetical protein
MKSKIAPSRASGAVCPMGREQYELDVIANGTPQDGSSVPLGSHVP